MNSFVITNVEQNNEPDEKESNHARAYDNNIAISVTAHNPINTKLYREMSLSGILLLACLRSHCLHHRSILCHHTLCSWFPWFISNVSR